MHRFNVLLLNSVNNKPLQAELRLEYIKTDYLGFVENIQLAIEPIGYTDTGDLAKAFFYQANKIILDNIIKLAMNQGTTEFIRLANNGTLFMSFDIKPFYVYELLTMVKFNRSLEDTEIYDEAILYLRNRLQQFLQKIYRENTRGYNLVLVPLYEELQRFLAPIGISPDTPTQVSGLDFKVFLVDNIVPALYLNHQCGYHNQHAISYLTRPYSHG